MRMRKKIPRHGMSDRKETVQMEKTKITILFSQIKKVT
jgi:hypothetical protein